MRIRSAGVAVMALVFIAMACGGGGGKAKDTTAYFSHDTFTEDNRGYTAELEVAGVTLSAFTGQSSEETLLPACGVMPARFFMDRSGNIFHDFPEVDIKCNKVNYLHVTYQEGALVIWFSTDPVRLQPAG